MNEPDAIPIVPAELRPVERALDALGEAERHHAPAGLERRIALASGPRLSTAQRTLRPAVRPLLGLAAAIAIVAVGAWLIWLGGGRPAGLQNTAAADPPDAAAIEADLDAWLEASSWTVVSAAQTGSEAAADDLLNDFWPSLDDPLVNEESL